MVTVLEFGNLGAIPLQLFNGCFNVTQTEGGLLVGLDAGLADHLESGAQSVFAWFGVDNVEGGGVHVRS